MSSYSNLPSARVLFACITSLCILLAMGSTSLVMSAPIYLEDAEVEAECEEIAIKQPQCDCLYESVRFKKIDRPYYIPAPVVCRHHWRKMPEIKKEFVKDKHRCNKDPQRRWCAELRGLKN